jgi:hypothetical protein
MNDRDDVAKWYAAINGIILIGVGLLGFVDNPIVSRPEANPLFHTDLIHNVVHLATGAVALYIAFGLAGRARANGLIAFGAVYAAVLALTLIDPRLFGLLQHPVNTADHVLHFLLAAGAIAVGLYARSTDRVRATS